MPSTVKTNPTLVVIRPDAFDVSPPLRTVDISVAPRPTVRPELERVLPRSGPIAPAPDPVAQTTARALMPEPLKSFEGIKNLDNVVSVDPLIGPVIPPDVEGDVGPNDYVEYVNLAWSVYDKSSGAPRPGFPKPNGAIWAGFADETCRDDWSGDPIVLYDQAANRWLLSEFAFRSTSGGPGGPFKICVAVSTSGDPTGSYARYAYSGFQGFPDYPKFGIWPDGYYMSANLIGFPFTYAGAGAAAFEAMLIETEPFNERRFRRALVEIRELTIKNPQFALKRLQAICATAGVAVVLLPELVKTRTSGAARWLTPIKALIQLSDRHKADDHFWFSFFHEAGHLLLHSKKETFITADATKMDREEQEANAFAEAQLIPRRYERRLRSLHTDADVRAFAHELGIAPGIVVGRLHSDELWAWSKGNRLRQPINFDNLMSS